MKLGPDLLKKLGRLFEPSAMINMHYRGNDLAVKTDKEGNAIQLFIGRMDEQGILKGERYARVLKKDKEGRIIKDHWDHKGRSS